MGDGGEQAPFLDAQNSMASFLVYRPGGNGQPVSARDELYRLTQQCKTQSSEVNQMRMSQFEVLQSGTTDQHNQVRNQVSELCLHLSTAQKNVDLMMDKYLLEPIEIFQVRFLAQQFRIFYAYADALLKELMWVYNGRLMTNTNQAPFLGSIFFREAPEFAMVAKSKLFDETFVIEVSTGVSQEIQFVGPMQCLADHGEGKSPLDDSQVSVDPQRRTAIFANLKPSLSTRMQFAQVRFSCRVSVGGSEPQLLESEFSAPFIVITHESQWVEAEAKLSVAESFGEGKSIAWQRFANVVSIQLCIIETPLFLKCLTLSILTLTYSFRFIFDIFECRNKT